MARPKINQPLSQPEKLLQILSLTAVAGMVVLTVIAWIRLPQSIPSHFGAGGTPDAYGGKGSLLLLPIFSVVMYIALTALERFPWIYNYPGDVTEENAPRYYRYGRLMIECLKLITILIFLYLQWQTYRVGEGASGGLGVWFLPVSMIALFGVMGLLIYKMVKNK